MIVIDGSLGEGGGQILRSSLALSLVTGRPFRIENIRARRKKPGLMRQHLAAVHAAEQVGDAAAEGDEPGSWQLRFVPGKVRPGEYRFSVGTAGSCTLVMQTVLPALLLADKPSKLILEGGTHNPYAPPFDFLARAFLPLLERMGPKVAVSLQRPGFYPAGGGRFTARIEPVAKLGRLELLERGRMVSCRAVGSVARLPRHIAERELKVLRRELGWPEAGLRVEEVASSAGPGNILTAVIESGHITEVFTGFGERGVSAERVAEGTADEIRDYLESGAPVGSHLADQLLIPLALAGGGAFRTMEPTLHTRTNIEVLKRFLDVEAYIERRSERVWEVRIDSGAPVRSEG